MLLKSLPTLVAKGGGVATEKDEVKTFDVFEHYALLDLGVITASNQWYCQVPIFNNEHALSHLNCELLWTNDEVGRYPEPLLLQDVCSTYN